MIDTIITFIWGAIIGVCLHVNIPRIHQAIRRR